MINVSDLIEKIKELSDKQKTLLVAIDGRGGSGKSTLAGKIKQKLPNVTIVHLDDFAYPMGIADRQRLLDQVILPLKSGQSAKYQRYDWQSKNLAEWVTIEPSGIVVIEGVLTLHAILYKYYDFKIWIECPPEIGFQRGVKRDINDYKVDTTDEWLNNWLPEEKKAIDEQRPQEKADYILDGTEKEN